VVKKILPWLILIILAAIVGVFSLTEIYRFPKSIDYVQLTFPPKTEKKETTTVILVGDIMLDRGVEAMIKNQGAGDYKFPFLEIADYLTKADILFGNLESVISDKGTKLGSIYSFRAKPEAIEGLTFAGFDVLSIANNHAFDYGREALEDTFLRLKEAGIEYVGASFPIVKEINNTKIAFLAYTNLGSPYWDIGWADWNNLEEIKEEIKETKGLADILIISLHSGEEYWKTPTQFQIEFSKIAIEAGADLVVGHHPHVIQINEKYKQGFIFYSLGNFIFDQGFSKETMQGLLLEVIIKNKKIAEIKQRKIQINQCFQATID